MGADVAVGGGVVAVAVGATGAWGIGVGGGAVGGTVAAAGTGVGAPAPDGEASGLRGTVVAVGPAGWEVLAAVFAGG